LYKHFILLSPFLSYEENEVLRIWLEVFVTFDDILERAKPKQRLWNQMPFGGLQIGRSAWHPKFVKHVIRFPPCCAFLWKYVGKIGTKKLKLIAIFNLEGIELNPVAA
jgi:hypothetical protein